MSYINYPSIAMIGKGILKVFSYLNLLTYPKSVKPDITFE